VEVKFPLTSKGLKLGYSVFTVSIFSFGVFCYRCITPKSFFRVRRTNCTRDSPNRERRWDDKRVAHMFMQTKLVHSKDIKRCFCSWWCFLIFLQFLVPNSQMH